MRLLDIGCGWGSTALRAAERWHVRVTGLTLSQHQLQRASQRTAHLPGVEIRLQGWEEFDEPVDRIVSIGAFEHFRRSRYDAFFSKCHQILPSEGGRMMLHTILLSDPEQLAERGMRIEHEHVLFAKFIGRAIFPGGQLCTATDVIRHARAAGFRVEKTQSLQSHYARTLDCWAENLRNALKQAESLTSPDVYEMYMKYLTGCAKFFRSGHIDVVQFTLVKERGC
jgi:cyclopropane-fatty-acyl-phospholipid synthase